MAHHPAGWTSRNQLPWTGSNQQVHEEIHQEQCVHWSREQIEAAERQGYFTDLTQRCQSKRYGSLLDEAEEGLELE